MKAIGTTSGGGLLLEVNVSEARLLAGVAAALAPLAASTQEEFVLGLASVFVPAQLPEPLPEPEPEKSGASQKATQRTKKARRHGTFVPGEVVGGRKKKPRPSRAEHAREKNCLVCGDPFVDETARNKAVTCSASCWRTRKLQAAEARRRKAGMKPRQSKSGKREAGSARTEISREERLRLIREAQNRVAERSPLDRANEAANNLKAEDTF